MTKAERRRKNAATKRRTRAVKTAWLKRYFGIASADGLLAAAYAGKIKIVRVAASPQA